jgi:hypothetical protein
MTRTKHELRSCSLNTLRPHRFTQIRAFTVDASGRMVIIALSPSETEEFLRIGKHIGQPRGEANA